MLRNALLLSAILALSGPVGISTRANANFTPYESVEAARSTSAETVAQRPSAEVAARAPSINRKHKAKRKAVASLGDRKVQWTYSPIILGVAY